MQKQTINVGGRIVDLTKPLVMGIVNLTPDSFYSASRKQSELAIRSRIETIISEGADFADLGAYSSRPGADWVSIEEEKARLEPALRILRDEYPHLMLSVDTFRSEVARWACSEYGVGIVNDISGGGLDEQMFRSVVELQVPYILMHMRGTPQTMQSLTDYQDLGLEVLDYFIERSEVLRSMGLHDLIIDPGFGFAKSLEQNYELMAYLPRLKEALALPILVGVSRKSMIYKALDTTPEESLNGSTILHTYALLAGANILRVHDVWAAREAVRLCGILREQSPSEENPISVIRPQR